MSAAKKPGQSPGPIQPFDLAVACCLYEQMTPYARFLDRLRAATGRALDLVREDHRLALLQFLNDWGCRNLATNWHWLASKELGRWCGSAQDRLGLLDDSLADFDVTHVGDLAGVFYSLSTRIIADDEGVTIRA
jgi:hypothetical protein